MTRNPSSMPGGSVKGCIKKVKRDRKKVSDPGAYCAAIADEAEPGWRKKTMYKKRKVTRNKRKKRNKPVPLSPRDPLAPQSRSKPTKAKRKAKTTKVKAGKASAEHKSARTQKRGSKARPKAKTATIAYKKTTPRGISLPKAGTWVDTPKTKGGRYLIARRFAKGFTATVSVESGRRLYPWVVQDSEGKVVAKGEVDTIKGAKTRASKAGKEALKRREKAITVVYREEPTNQVKLPRKKRAKKKTSKKKTGKKKTTKKKTTKRSAAKKTSKKTTSKKRASKKTTSRKKTSKKKTAKKRTSKKRTSKKRKGEVCIPASEFSQLKKLLRRLEAKATDGPDLAARKAAARAEVRRQMKALRDAAACQLGNHAARERGQKTSRKCPPPKLTPKKSAEVLGYARAIDAKQKTKSATALVNEFMRGD